MVAGGRAIEVVRVSISYAAEGDRGMKATRVSATQTFRELPFTMRPQELSRPQKATWPVGLQAAVHFRGRSAGVTQGRETSARREAVRERG
jgi:hypothetical protein